MKIDYIKGICQFRQGNQQVTIKSELIYDVGEITFSFMGEKIIFTHLRSKTSYFFFNDLKTFSRIIQLLYNNLSEFESLINRYFDKPGTMQTLLKCLCMKMCDSYDLTERLYTYMLNSNTNTDLRSKELIEKYCITYYREHCIFDSCKCLLSDLEDLLQVNLSCDLAKREERQAFYNLSQRNKAAKESVLTRSEQILVATKLISEIRESYSDVQLRTNFKSSLMSEEQVDIRKCERTQYYIKQQKEQLEQFSLESLISPDDMNEMYLLLENAGVIVARFLKQGVAKKIENKFGKIVELKRRLRSDIFRLEYKELYRLYIACSQCYKIISEESKIVDSVEKNVYQPYLNLYYYGMILSGYQLNQQRKKQDKIETFTQKHVDEAMMFFYETDNLIEAYELHRYEKYEPDIERMETGEKNLIEYLNQIIKNIRPTSDIFFEESDECKNRSIEKLFEKYTSQSDPEFTNAYSDHSDYHTDHGEDLDNHTDWGGDHTDWGADHSDHTDWDGDHHSDHTDWGGDHTDWGVDHSDHSDSSSEGDHDDSYDDSSHDDDIDSHTDEHDDGIDSHWDFQDDDNHDDSVDSHMDEHDEDSHEDSHEDSY